MARKSRKINSVNNGNSINPAATDIHIPEKSLLRTAAYCRLSVENSGNETEETLVTQEKMVRDFIKSHPDLEWKIVQTRKYNQRKERLSYLYNDRWRKREFELRRGQLIFR